MKKILVFNGISQKVIDYLEGAHFEVVINSQDTDEDFTQYGEDLYGIIVMMHKIDEKIIQKLPNLKIIARFGVGYDNVNLDDATKYGVTVTNAPGANAVSVAETAVMHMLMAGRLFYQYHQKMIGQADNDFLAQYRGQEITGKTVGIIGFGNIGQTIAQLLSGFNVNILAYARHDRDVPNGRMASLDEIYQQADFIVLALPATANTVGMVNQDAFDQMKSNTVLVNIARGSVIDEPALVEALKAHKIAGAGLDVTVQEPLPADSELLQLPNVFVTPHIAANSKEAHENVGLYAAEEIVRLLTGKEVRSQVN